MRVITVIKILVAGIFGFLIAKILDDFFNNVGNAHCEKNNIKILRGG